MALKKEISERMKNYMREKKAMELAVIRQLKTEIMKFETSGASKEAEDADILKIVNALVKQHQESIDIYEKNDRKDLLEKEVVELEVLKSLLPAELTEAELSVMIETAIQSTGASTPKEMGLVVKAVKDLVSESGKGVDGRVLADMIKKRLST
jgi:uncharacterized protein